METVQPGLIGLHRSSLLGPNPERRVPGQIFVLGQSGLGKQAFAYWFTRSGLTQGDYCLYVTHRPVSDIERDMKWFGTTLLVFIFVFLILLANNSNTVFSPLLLFAYAGYRTAGSLAIKTHNIVGLRASGGLDVAGEPKQSS